MCGYSVAVGARPTAAAPGRVPLRDLIPPGFTRAFEPHVVRRREHDYYLPHLRRRNGEFSIVDFFSGLDLTDGDERDQGRVDNLLRIVADIDPASVEQLRLQLLDAVVNRIGVHFVVVPPIPGSGQRTHTIEQPVADSGSERRMVIVCRIGEHTWLWNLLEPPPG